MTDEEKQERHRRQVANLKPFKPMNQLTPAEREKQKAIAIKGGMANKERIEKQKSLNDLAKALLDTKINRVRAVEILGEDIPLLDEIEALTVGNVLNLKMIQEAASGTVKAYEALRDTAGYAPKKEVEITADVTSDADRALMLKISNRLGTG